MTYNTNFKGLPRLPVNAKITFNFDDSTFEAVLSRERMAKIRVIRVYIPLKPETTRTSNFRVSTGDLDIDIPRHRIRWTIGESNSDKALSLKGTLPSNDEDGDPMLCMPQQVSVQFDCREWLPSQIHAANLRTLNNTSHSHIQRGVRYLTQGNLVYRL
jgi:hypothetical protein